MKIVWSLIASVVTLGLTMGPGSAATTTCGTLGVGTVAFIVSGTTPPCFATGDGQINNATDHPFGLASPLVYLDKSGTAGDPIEGALTITAGNWSINASLLAGYSKLVLLFQQSNNPNRTPDWAAFLLSATGGTWLIETLVQGGNPKNPPTLNTLTLSHAILYGDPTPTPLPGALALFGTILLGSGGVARWRKWRQRIAA